MIFIIVFNFVPLSFYYIIKNNSRIEKESPYNLSLRKVDK